MSYVQTIILLIISFFPLTIQANPQHLHHLELELTSYEYKNLMDQFYRKHPELFNLNDPLQRILLVGKRNLDWFEFINQQRVPEKKLKLSTAETQRGIPITSPNKSNRKIIQELYSKTIDKIPKFMRDVLLNNSPFVAKLPISDEEFITQMREVDRTYQKTSRWLLLEPNLAYYTIKSKNDLRGYYYLSIEEDRDRKLRAWKILDEATQERLKKLLIGQCTVVLYDEAKCVEQFSIDVEPMGEALTFFNKYASHARERYNYYFRLNFFRTDVQWYPENPNLMRVPFLDPGKAKVKNWLQFNVEDEWRFGEWRLKLNFLPSGFNITQVVFEPGVTPHVNGLAGNIITMDANRPIEEYDSGWTIRHEYGHTLGFNDCYLEFYDIHEEVMISYQLDITNLMCSRRGHIQEQHITELRRVYFKEQAAF